VHDIQLTISVKKQFLNNLVWKFAGHNISGGCHTLSWGFISFANAYNHSLSMQRPWNYSNGASPTPLCVKYLPGVTTWQQTTENVTKFDQQPATHWPTNCRSTMIVKGCVYSTTTYNHTCHQLWYGNPNHIRLTLTLTLLLTTNPNSNPKMKSLPGRLSLLLSVGR